MDIDDKCEWISEAAEEISFLVRKSDSWTKEEIEAIIGWNLHYDITRRNFDRLDEETKAMFKAFSSKRSVLITGYIDPDDN